MKGRLAYSPENALNAICPYFTMFPIEYPLRVLRSHRRANAVVTDPFCGRGTTLFAARTLGLVSFGIDSSPVAVAIAQAKLCQVDVDAAIELARTLVATVNPADIPTSSFFREAFHPEVLSRLCSLREGLLAINSQSDASVLLRAAVLGCLHGPRSKVLTNQSYFSNQMPRTFSSKPEYSVKYWRDRRLVAPNVNVFEVIKRKISRIVIVNPPNGLTFANVKLGDSRDVNNFPSDTLNFSAVVTSPPYYGMRTYVEDQWLRNWFLGGPDHVLYSNKDQLQHTGQVVFAESLGQVWRNMGRSTAHELHMYVRFGIIPSVKVNAKDLMLASLEASTIPWRVVSVRSASSADSGKRQADQMTTKSKAAIEYDFHIVRQ